MATTKTKQKSKKTSTKKGGIETLEGLVDRVFFTNPVNGYCVFRFNVNNEAKFISVVANQIVKPNDRITIEGEWVRNEKYGRQFQATTIEVTKPKTVAGIEKYLASGILKGVGEATAKRIVEAFGEDVFKVIEEHPERLKEVKGLGKQRIGEILSKMTAEKTVRDIMVFLHSNGVTTSKARKIFDTYGSKAVHVLKKNPYILCDDVYGIGFITADEIAGKLGVEQNSLMRAQAGVNYVLREACESDGHCFLPRSELIKEAHDLLDIDNAIVEDAISEEVLAGNLVEANIPEDGSIFWSLTYGCERAIARRLKTIKKGALPWNVVDVDSAISESEAELGIQLASSQKEAVRSALQSKVMVITGGPGVGKTTIIRVILNILKKHDININLCAPTGRAAKRMAETSGEPASTIHRLIEFSPREGKFLRNEDRPLDCDLLVVDECSMLDVLLGNSLLKAVPDHAAVIFVGDVDQLPSVGPGTMLSSIIDSEAYAVIRLTEIFRQAKTSRIVEGAHLINSGKIPSFPDVPFENGDFHFVDVEDNAAIPDTIVSLVKEVLPAKLNVDFKRDIQVLCPMRRGPSGTMNLNELLQQALNPPKETAVRVFNTRFDTGDKVMQVVNNYDKGVFNGDVGFITQLDSKKEALTVDFDGHVVTYQFKDLDNLMLCYATTIHKSQGSEYPVVVLPITMQHYIMLKRNLLYTGVTRGRKCVVLVGDKRALAMAVKDELTEERYTSLKELLEESKPAQKLTSTAESQPRLDLVFVFKDRRMVLYLLKDFLDKYSHGQSFSDFSSWKKCGGASACVEQLGRFYACESGAEAIEYADSLLAEGIVEERDRDGFVQRIKAITRSALC